MSERLNAMEQERRNKLMIVDDHAETRILIRELIGRLANEVRECVDGREAAVQCVDFRPDVVTMDLNMPLSGGLEATRKIVDEIPGVRVIIVSDFDTLEFRLAAARAGACHFFSKGNLIGLLRYLEQQQLR